MKGTCDVYFRCQLHLKIRTECIKVLLQLKYNCIMSIYTIYIYK